MNHPSRTGQAGEAPHSQTVSTSAVKNLSATPFGRLLVQSSIKSDPDDRRSRIQLLLIAHEVVFFHRITEIFHSLRGNRPVAASVSTA